MTQFKHDNLMMAMRYSGIIIFFLAVCLSHCFSLNGWAGKPEYPAIFFSCKMETGSNGTRMVALLVKPDSVVSKKINVSDDKIAPFSDFLYEKGVYYVSVAVFNAKDSLINAFERRFFISGEETGVHCTIRYSIRDYKFNLLEKNVFDSRESLMGSEHGMLVIEKHYPSELKGKYDAKDEDVRSSEPMTFPDDWTTDVRSHYGNEPIENKMKKKKEIDPTPDYSRLL